MASEQRLPNWKCKHTRNFLWDVSELRKMGRSPGPQGEVQILKGLIPSLHDLVCISHLMEELSCWRGASRLSTKGDCSVTARPACEISELYVLLTNEKKKNNKGQSTLLIGDRSWWELINCFLSHWVRHLPNFRFQLYEKLLLQFSQQEHIYPCFCNLIRVWQKSENS